MSHSTHIQWSPKASAMSLIKKLFPVFFAMDLTKVASEIYSHKVQLLKDPHNAQRALLREWADLLMVCTAFRNGVDRSSQSMGIMKLARSKLKKRMFAFASKLRHSEQRQSRTCTHTPREPSPRPALPSAMYWVRSSSARRAARSNFTRKMKVKMRLVETAQTCYLDVICVWVCWRSLSCGMQGTPPSRDLLPPHTTRPTLALTLPHFKLLSEEICSAGFALLQFRLFLSTQRHYVCNVLLRCARGDISMMTQMHVHTRTASTHAHARAHVYAGMHTHTQTHRQSLYVY